MRAFLSILFLFCVFPTVFAEEAGNRMPSLEADVSKASKMAEKFFNSEADEGEASPIVLEAEEVPDEAKPQNDVMVQSSLEAAGQSLPVGTTEVNSGETAGEEVPQNAQNASEGPSEKSEVSASKEVQSTGKTSDSAPAPSSAENLTAQEIALQKTLTNPRATVIFFLEQCIQKHYNQAILAMDFSAQPTLSDVERENLAYQLQGIFARLDNFQFSGIPEEYERAECYLMPDRNYHAIVLTRQADGTWRIGAATVADIPSFYEKIHSKAPNFVRKTWLSFLPDIMFQEFFGMALIQWTFFGFFVLLGLGTAWVIPKIFAPLSLFLIHITQSKQEYTPLVRRVFRPLAFYAMVYVWFGGLKFVQAAPLVQSIAGHVIHPLGFLILTIMFLRGVDVFGLWFRKRLERRGNKTGTVLVDIISGGLKFLVVCTGVICIAQIFGFSALGIVSGMGIGGVAVALAAQQTIANFFGSVTILLDRPFTVGDRVVIGSVEGIIESIGVRSTRIRTLYDSSVVIPNSTLSTDTIDNLGRRAARRFRTMLTVTYNTPPEKLQEFCGRIKAILRDEPKVLEERSSVTVYDLSASSIDILFNCFFKAADATEENVMRERLLLKILKLAREMEVDFAFPTQTNYVIQEKN